MNTTALLIQENELLRILIKLQKKDCDKVALYCIDDCLPQVWLDEYQICAEKIKSALRKNQKVSEDILNSIDKMTVSFYERKVLSYFATYVNNNFKTCVAAIAANVASVFNSNNVMNSYIDYAKSFNKFDITFISENLVETNYD